MPVTDFNSAQAAADVADTALKAAIAALPALVQACVSPRIALFQYQGRPALPGGDTAARAAALDAVGRTIYPWIDSTFGTASAVAGFGPGSDALAFIVKVPVPR